MSTPRHDAGLLPRPKDQSKPDIIMMQNQVLIRLTVPLTIAAFILAIVAIESPSWATVSNYDGVSRTFIGTSTRGPFKYCLLVLNSNAVTGSTNPADYHQDCSVPRCTTSAPNYDEEFFCQQLRISGNLLISGAVFLGLAMLMTFPALAFLTAGSVIEKKRVPPYFVLPLPRSLYASFMVFGFVLFAAGNILGAEVLVNQQRDDGDFISSIGSVRSATGHWMVERGAWIGFSAWIIGMFGALFMNEATLARWGGLNGKNVIAEERNEA